jgi:hypothetical protein
MANKHQGRDASSNKQEEAINNKHQKGEANQENWRNKY